MIRSQLEVADDLFVDLDRAVHEAARELQRQVVLVRYAEEQFDEFGPLSATLLSNTIPRPAHAG